MIETTAFGAAALAGLAVGFWNNLDEIETTWETDRIFEPQISKDEAHARLALWQQAVKRCSDWAAL